MERDHLISKYQTDIFTTCEWEYTLTFSIDAITIIDNYNKLIEN